MGERTEKKHGPRSRLSFDPAFEGSQRLVEVTQRSPVEGAVTCTAGRIKPRKKGGRIHGYLTKGKSPQGGAPPVMFVGL